MSTKTFKWFGVILVVVCWTLILCATSKVMSDEHIPEATEFVEVLEETTDTRLADDHFNNMLKQVREFYKAVVGFDVKTQVVEILIWDPNSSILAYCRPSNGDYPKYLAFNHNLIKQVTRDNLDMVFQVILHEYTHCEGGIAHIQMQGHFMNDGGNPDLSIAETKVQFIDFLQYYRKFYKTLKR